MLKLIALALAAVNVFVALAADAPDSDSATLTGYIIGRVFAFPLVVMGLAAISPAYRNDKSMTKIFFWTSVVVLVSLMGSFLRALGGSPS